MRNLLVINQNAAFVDIGSEQMYVSVAGDTPEVFGTTTIQLHALRDWLKSQQATSIAMEATGVYWLPLFGILEEAGFDVIMVNGRQIKNSPGRKTDMQDSQWGATLHAHGLLRAGFVPPAPIRQLQDYQRLRNDHVSMAASHVQHMQKAMERMNIKIQCVISSVVGVSGQAVIRAILAGERDLDNLVALCDIQIRRTKAARVKESLLGTWSPEHLFALRQSLQSWEHYQQQIAACDQQMEVLLRTMEETLPPQDNTDKPPSAKAMRRKARGVNAPQISDLRGIITRLCGGNDLTALPAHTEYSVLQLISEVGTDLTKWATEKHFTAWLGLAPGSRQSGKRRGSAKRNRNRAGRLFCVMAHSLARSKDMALGGFYRRLAARRGAMIATMAVARKLAVMFWRVMVKGIAFVEEGLARYEAKILENKHRALQSLAKQLGQTLVPIRENP